MGKHLVTFAGILTLALLALSVRPRLAWADVGRLAVRYATGPELPAVRRQHIDWAGLHADLPYV